MTTVLRMYRGDTRVFDVTITDENGTAVDLSTSDLRFTAKYDSRDPDDEAVIVKTVDYGGIDLGPGTGEATITIDPLDTADLERTTTLLWDLQVTDSTGQVSTAAGGRLIISADISVTTP
jgi:hypothetical protein